MALTDWLSWVIELICCNALSLSFKAIEFATTKSCNACCQCMRRFPGCFWIIVRIIIFIIFIAVAICLAMVTYMFLYWWIIPSLHYERPIYFDYSQSLPTSIINIDQEYEWYLFDLPFEYMQQSESSLKPNELYDISINLHIPFKQSMHQIGNVMVKLSLYSCNDRNVNDDQQILDSFQKKYGWKLLRKASRPILLKYESTMIRMIKKIVCIIPYCLGLMKEERYLSIPIMTSFDEKFEDPLCAAVIQLSSKDFNVYDASIYFDIQLQGIKYFVYHWWLTSGVLLVSILSFVCCLSGSPALIFCCYQVNKVRDFVREQYVENEFEAEEEEEEEMQLPIDLNNNDAGSELLNEEEDKSKAMIDSVSLSSSSSIMEAEKIEENVDGILDQTGIRKRTNLQ